MLSRKDTRRLALLERQLLEEDPEFCRRMTSGHVRPLQRKRAPLSLILTAIVVGVATLAVGLAIAVRIREAYGSVEGADIAAKDRVTLSANRPAEPSA